MRFTAPLEGARTFWHTLYDTTGASAELGFYLYDEDGGQDRDARSVYSTPIEIALAPPNRAI